MFSVRNRSNIRQVTPYGEFDAFESKSFYPVSKIYANAKTFFIGKSQFEIFIERLPSVQKVVAKTKEEVIPLVVQSSEEKLKEEVVTIPTEVTPEAPVEEVIEEVTEKAKPKGRRSL